MTQEEKAKRYDEALHKAKNYYSTTDSSSDIKLIGLIFPELKESEDERIRKEIIDFLWKEKIFLQEAHSSVENNPKYRFVMDAIAWLEKQGEHKPADKEYTFKAIPRLLGMIPPTDRAKSYCQKLIDSLEQEGYSTDAKIVRDCLKQMNGEKVAMATMDEQNPAWSDEDEEMLNSFLHKLEVCDLLSNKECLWIKNKLKALKQNTWKPSDEQMDALNYVVNLMASSERPTENDLYYNILKSLRQQLKKLREK